MTTRPASVLLALAMAACGGSSPLPSATTASSAASPTWERPGLGGAVRPEMGSPQPGEAAPELALPDLEGRSVSLSSMRGSWVVLHFTATWCPYCDSEVAHLNELAEAYAGRNVRTVIVDVAEPAATWHAYAGKHVAKSVVALLDGTGASTSRFAPPRAQPSFENRAQAVLDGTLIIDPQGKIRLFLLPDSAHFDPTFGGVRRELDRLLPEPVVSASAEALEAVAGAQGEVVVTLRVAAGYHVMSDRPSEPSYIPTRVTIEGGESIAVGDARYPTASSFSFSGRTIATFAGSAIVRIPIDIAPSAAAGDHELHGAVRYQACTETRCLFPETKTFDALLHVPPN